MGRDSSEIRAEIEETRARVGEDVDALSYKTDVKARASDYVDEKKEAVVSKVKGAGEAVASAGDSVLSGVTGAVPDGQQVKGGAGRMKRLAESNPVGLAVGGAAVGFLVGTLLPSTRVEDEQVGEISDRVGEVVRDTGQEAVERAKHVVEEAGQAASETARTEGEELASHLQDEVRSSS